MNLESILEMLVEELKLEALPLKDKNGSFQLKINAETQVSLKELNPGLYFSAKIMEIPKEENKEALFIYLMKANLLGKGTGKAAIGIDQSEKYLMLSLTLPFEVDYTLFHENLEDLLNYIDYWKEEVPRFQQTLL